MADWGLGSRYIHAEMLEAFIWTGVGCMPTIYSVQCHCAEEEDDEDEDDEPRSRKGGGSGSKSAKRAPAPPPSRRGRAVGSNGCITGASAASFGHTQGQAIRACLQASRPTPCLHAAVCTPCACLWQRGGWITAPAQGGSVTAGMGAAFRANHVPRACAARHVAPGIIQGGQQ